MKWKGAYFCFLEARTLEPSKRPHRRQGGPSLGPAPLLGLGLSVFLLCNEEH
jgi:hypothetical protein